MWEITRSAMEGQSKCLEELAKMRGVEWNRQDNEGRTLLYVALHNGNPDRLRTALRLYWPSQDWTSLSRLRKEKR